MAAITEVVKRRADGSGRSINERLPRPRPPFHPRVRSYTLFPSSARTPLMPPISFTVNGKRETVNVTPDTPRSEEHTSELQSRLHLVCRLLLEKKKNTKQESLTPSTDDPQD